MSPFFLILILLSYNSNAKSVASSNVARQNTVLNRLSTDEVPPLYPYIPPEKYTSSPSTAIVIAPPEPPLYPYIPPEEKYTSNSPSASLPELEESIGGGPAKHSTSSSEGWKSKAGNISSLISICFSIGTLLL
mmetsp:Transcript_21550/g.27195  ORF Transcript_21550/g.27195 Transcript_21550/m.27195 type:complete len:133 (-) Transcript_21550:417-815(-)